MPKRRKSIRQQCTFLPHLSRACERYVRRHFDMKGNSLWKILRDVEATNQQTDHSPGLFEVYRRGGRTE